MKLIHKLTKQEIKVGSILPTGEEVIYCPPPHKPSSEGKMQAKDTHGEVTGLYYCACFNCEWIDREDRQEELAHWFAPALASSASRSSSPASTSSRVRTADQTTINQIALMQKKLAEFQDIVDQIETLIDGYLDGSGDCSPISQLANQISHIINS